MRMLFWWIDRWRKSTAYTDLTLEEQAAYRNLLDEQTLRGGPIPNDERILARACGDALRWRKVRAAVLARFELVEGGWTNRTCEEVNAKSAEVTEQRSEAGRRGAMSRWRRHWDSKRIANAMANALATDETNDIANSVANSVASGVASGIAPDPDPDQSSQRAENSEEALKSAPLRAREKTPEKPKKLKEILEDPPDLAARAGAFCEWYADTHLRLVGVGYIGNPRADFETACRLVATFSDEVLHDAAVFWFGQRDAFATHGTRTLGKFASRASDCVLQARKVVSS